MCTYFSFKELTNNLFYGSPLTNEHMNNAVETIRRFLVDGGAAHIAKQLGIGVRVEEMQNLTENRVLSRRFIFIDGPRKGDVLSTGDIESIALFLPHGPLYGKI